MDLEDRERDCTHRSESARDGDSGHGAAGLPQSVPEHCVYMEFRKELGDGLFSEERWVNWRRRRMERVVGSKGRGEERFVVDGRALLAASQRLPGRALNPVGSSEQSDSALVPRIPCQNYSWIN